MRAHARPSSVVERLARGLHRFVHVGLVALGDEREHFLVRRVDGLEGLAGFWSDPFAADQKMLGLLEKVQSRAVPGACRCSFNGYCCCCHGCSLLAEFLTDSLDHVICAMTYRARRGITGFFTPLTSFSLPRPVGGKPAGRNAARRKGGNTRTLQE